MPTGILVEVSLSNWHKIMSGPQPISTGVHKLRTKLYLLLSLSGATILQNKSE